MKNSPVVAQSAPQKPYRLSPIQDRKRRGSGGLLSRLAVHAARRDGEDCEAAQSFGGNGGWVLCVRREERPLFYSHRGTNSQKTNRTVSYSFSTQANRFSFHVTVQFHSPVMRDKKKGSAPRHIPQTAARARCDKAGGGGARMREPSCHTLLPQGKELTLYVGPTPSKLARWD
jgi:hypothetical protein